MAEKTVTPEEFQRVIQAVELLGVYVISGTFDCTLNIPVEPAPPQSNVNIQIASSWKYSDDGSLLLCDFKLEVDAHELVASPNDNAQTGKQIFKLVTTFRVVYKISDRELNNDAVHLFCEKNGLFNVYPYMREYVDTCTRKMGVPPMVFPLLKPPSPPKKQ